MFDLVFDVNRTYSQFSAKTILQAALFNRTVKQIEGDDISAMEVGHAMNVFIESLQERKENQYLSSAVTKEIERVAVECDSSVSKERVLTTTTLFYG